MTEDEMKLIVSITNGADSGCSVCSLDLALKLAEVFPQFKELIILTVAHRILGDKDKRDKYDRHGTVNDEPDRRQAQALELVMSIIDQMLGSPEAIYTDLVGHAKQVVNSRIAEHQQAIANAKVNIERVDKMRKRFSAKKGKPDRIGLMLESKIDGMKHTIVQIEEALDICRMAIAVLDDHQFQADARPAPTYQTWSGSMGSNSSTSFNPLGVIFGR